MPENIKEKIFSGAPYLLAVASFFVGEWDGREDAKAESPAIQIHFLSRFLARMEM